MLYVSFHFLSIRLYLYYTQQTMTKLYIGILTLSLFLTSCNKNKDLAQVLKTESGDHPYEVKFNKLSPKYKLEKKDKIDQFYNQKIKKGYWGGFLVAKNGEILYEDYQGYANYETKDPITDSTPMHVASVGKVITAVGTLRLIDKKIINLDQKVSEILPGFPYETITVKMLLNHRSGIPNYSNFTANKAIWDTKKTLTNDDVLNLLKTKDIKLDFKPDTRFTYCNTNYVLLAKIVETVTKKSFQEALKILIFEPLRMENTFVLEDLSIKDKVTQSYYATNRKMHWDYLDGTYGDKNIYTTPRDMLKLDLALYSEQFLSKAIKDLMYKGYSYEKPGKNNYGLGIRMIEPTYASDDLYTFHNGWWRGNKPSYVTLRKDTVTIICFDNHNTGLAYKTKYLAPEFGNFSSINID